MSKKCNTKCDIIVYYLRVEFDKNVTLFDELFS